MKNEIVQLKTTCESNHITAVMVIHDYSNLVTPDWNRKFVPAGLKDLRDSMSLNGVLSSPTVVAVDGKWVVVDGNHRVKVAQEKGFSLTVIIIDLESTGMTINELMIWLNITPKKWTPADYLNNGVVYHKSHDYILLNELWEETDFAIPALYELYSFDTKQALRKNMFETGDWKITTKNLGNATIRHAEELAEWMPFYHKTNFLRALVKCVNKKGYNIKHMLKQTKRYKGKIHDSGDSLKGHLQMLHKIYNHKALEEEQLVLF